MYRIDGRLLLDITADATLENWERIGQLVMALNIRWGDNEEWTRNTLSPDISPMNANWDNYGIPGGYSIDYTALNVSGAAPGFSSGYFYIHNNSDPYDRWIYDPGLSQTRYLDFSVYIPVPNVQRTGLSIYPVLQVYDYTGDLSTGLRADIDASLLRLDVYKVVAEAVMELESFDFYARTTTGRDKVHFGTTLIGDFGVGQQMGGIEVLKDGGYGSTESWVSVSQSTPKKINQLAVEEVLAQHVKSKLVERGVLLTRGSWVPSVPYNQFYDSETGTYYHPLSWRMIATPVEHEVTLFKTGRDFENITSDEDNPTRNPFGQFGGGGIDAGTTVGNYGGRGLSAMFGYNSQAAEIFDAWTAGTVIGAGKTLEAYYTVVLNGQGKAVNFQGNLPADPNDVIERVIWVKSDGLADHTSTSGWTSPAGLQPTASTSAGPTLQECWEAINAYLTKFSGSQNNFTFLISYDEVFFEGLLDDYSGAAAAYSLRRLDSAYTGDPIRVRRAGDNVEADIPFTSAGDLDTDALAAHCGANNGYVKTWYDQSGNANDATQTTTANQPKIYDSSTGVLLENAKPAMQFDGSDDLFVGPAKTTIDDTAIFCVIKSDSNTQDSVFINNVFTAGNLVALGFGGFGSNNRIGSRLVVGNTTMLQVGDSTFTSTNQTLVSYLADNATGQMFIDGTEETDSVGCRYHSGQTVIGARGDGLYNFNGKMQEVIFYDSDESSNRTGIETNINDYYDIY
jgi:hypothetical protein